MAREKYDPKATSAAKLRGVHVPYQGMAQMQYSPGGKGKLVIPTTGTEYAAIVKRNPDAFVEHEVVVGGIKKRYDEWAEASLIAKSGRMCLKIGSKTVAFVKLPKTLPGTLKGFARDRLRQLKDAAVSKMVESIEDARRKKNPKIAEMEAELEKLKNMRW
jgi:hypothetical protein